MPEYGGYLPGKVYDTMKGYELHPVAFLWKTTMQVPESTFQYADGLKAAGVPYEVHVFTEHSVVTGTMDGYTCAKNTKLWVTLALNWLRELFGIEDQPFKA